ncbi:hypothetical protein EGW08_000450 [Elysia chlorotica]|uniref:Uncharacterized protein n=1 Tax=Elysia chlorotica TaxID=188477 RepID=A0A3S1A1V4_ELYCH|nr:hypothetical protein EGW08_000450 [Elysia chlorotica]
MQQQQKSRQVGQQNLKHSSNPDERHESAVGRDGIQASNAASQQIASHGAAVQRHTSNWQTSSVGPSPSRSDRRQPIIIQNFELLPVGQSHLRRRSLSTANLFLASASLRRGADSSGSAADSSGSGKDSSGAGSVLDRVRLSNCPGRVAEALVPDSSLDRPGMFTQAWGGQSSLEHPLRPDTSSSVPSSKSSFFNKNSSNWTSPNKSQNAKYSGNSVEESSVREQSPQILTSISKSQHQTDPKSQSPKANPDPTCTNGIKSSSLTRVASDNLTESKTELVRASSHPNLSNGTVSPKKTKSKKQVTFADSVSVPWPYTLAHDGKMWSTGNGSLDHHRTVYSEARFRGVDINNNMDTSLFPSPCYEDNIFRPVATWYQPRVERPKEPARIHQGILKHSGSGSQNGSKGEKILPRFDSVPVVTSEVKEVGFISVEDIQNGCANSEFDSKRGKLSTDNAASVLQDASHELNGPGFKQSVTGETGYNIAGEAHLPNNPQTEASSIEPSQMPSSETHFLYHGMENGCASPNDQHNHSENDAAPSTTENDLIVTRKLLQGLPDVITGLQQRGIVERVDTETDVCVVQSKDVNGDTNIQGSQDMATGSTKSHGWHQEQVLAKEQHSTTLKTHGSTSEVSTYTVPQLADSVDLSDYLRKMSQPGGSTSEKPLIAGGFRPRPNNVRFSSKPEVTRGVPGAVENWKPQPNNPEATDTNSLAVMRVRFLKDESDTAARKSDSEPATATSGTGSNSRLDHSDPAAMKVDGKKLHLTQSSALPCAVGQGSAIDNMESSSVPTRPLKPFKGKPGETYMSFNKTQGDVNTDYLMQMYSPTGERKASNDSSNFSTNTKTINSASAVGALGIDIASATDSVSRPPSGLTQRSRITATVTTPISPGTSGNIDVDQEIPNIEAINYITNRGGGGRASRESRRDTLNRKFAVTREDAFAFTPRSRERQRRLLTATLVGEPAPGLAGVETLTPRAVLQARARSSSASRSASATRGLQRGRGVSAHERTLGAMESVFLPGRMKSAIGSSSFGGGRGGAKGMREGVVYSMGRTQLNRRLEMLVMSTTRPNTAMERSRSNLS